MRHGLSTKELQKVRSMSGLVSHAASLYEELVLLMPGSASLISGIPLDAAVSEPLRNERGCAAFPLVHPCDDGSIVKTGHISSST